MGEDRLDPGRSVCGDPGQIAAETNRQLTAPTNPIEHLQLGAVEVRDDRHRRCDPGQPVVLRREVMKVRDRRACGPTLLTKSRCQAVTCRSASRLSSDANSRSGAPTRSSNDGCSGISPAIGSSPR